MLEVAGHEEPLPGLRRTLPIVESFSFPFRDLRALLPSLSVPPLPATFK